MDRLEVLGADGQELKVGDVVHCVWVDSSVYDKIGVIERIGAGPVLLITVPGYSELNGLYSGYPSTWVRSTDKQKPAPTSGMCEACEKAPVAPHAVICLPLHPELKGSRLCHYCYEHRSPAYVERDILENRQRQPGAIPLDVKSLVEARIQAQVANGGYDIPEIRSLEERRASRELFRVQAIEQIVRALHNHTFLRTRADVKNEYVSIWMNN
ncbi:MAG: hypothetical protein A2Z21_01935 [Candidatus Fraserbacteria bacterium RBG_16_55_9]|uniref:Uncharacterized protein n=1 Tax=Fraserbacteria sp. (strain RBG_16_55_9) TaxID=1817864 RepID=A0A1F5UP54_FRAXR|nr:MAG: hypothetical protein A2Z21_01935 [Candidatus Fraserbacteria bacterium RBG_16_55_9]